MLYNKIKKILSYQVLILVISLSVTVCMNSENSIYLKSPNDNLILIIKNDTKQGIHYTLMTKEDTIIAPSKLGIVMNETDFGQAVKFGKPIGEKIYTSSARRGVHSIAINKCRQLKLPVFHRHSDYEFQLEFRLFNDGLAYRYIMPGKGKQWINGEHSSWKIPQETRVWYFERKSNWKLKSYAGEWLSTTIDSLPVISPTGPVQGTPLVFELNPNQGFLLISEAALYNYSGMRLESVSDRKPKVNFTEGKTGFHVSDTVTTPWRVAIYTKTLNDLVNSDLIWNLNPQPDEKLFSDQEWIKPGRSVWRWWSLGTGNPDEEKRYIDYAQKLQFEYTMIDEGWEDWPDHWEKVKNLCTYGSKRNVGVWLWKHSNQLEDTTDNYVAMRTFLDKIKNVGAVGLKVDFMNAESKDKIDFEIHLLEEAAKRKLMVNFHGCQQASGEARTFPNEMTREGIRGLELNRMNEGPIPAWHNAALPFTRFVVGQADYTPLGFTAPGPTSWAHQLATVVVFTSPLQVIAENAEFLLNNEHIGPVLPVLTKIPTVWDETIVLPGSEIGKLAAFARRSGEIWFIGILNGGKRRSYEIDCSFLESASYSAVVVQDDLQADKIDLRGLNPKAKLKDYTHALPFGVERLILDKNSKMQVEMAAGGGFVAMVERRQ